MPPVPDEPATNNTQAVAEPTVDAGNGHSTPSPDVVEAVTQAVMQAVDGRFKKYNSELAGFRRKLKGPEAEPAPADAAGGQRDAAAATFTQEDVQAMISAERLRAQVPETVRDKYAEQLNALPPQQQSLMMAMLADMAAQPGRGATLEKTSARATVAAQRETAPRPSSQVEYFRLRKDDPKRAAALDADPSFDPGDLPYRN
tara:strand:+ start:4145 stop:4747 length:603 start_codon:yes stop_codon:yes gene_type:complete